MKVIATNMQLQPDNCYYMKATKESNNYKHEGGNYKCEGNRLKMELYFTKLLSRD